MYGKNDQLGRQGEKQGRRGWAVKQKRTADGTKQGDQAGMCVVKTRGKGYKRLRRVSQHQAVRQRAGRRQTRSAKHSPNQSRCVGCWHHVGHRCAKAFWVATEVSGRLGEMAQAKRAQASRHRAQERLPDQHPCQVQASALPASEMARRASAPGIPPGSGGEPED